MPGNPLTRALQIKPGRALTVLGAPPGFLERLEPLPDDLRCSKTLRREADILLAFVRTRREVRSGAGAWKRSLAPGGILWVCYPKLTSASAGELSRDVPWRDLEPLSLRPVAMVSIDPTWSAMRLKVIG